MQVMSRLLFFTGCLTLLLLSGCSVPSDYAESVSFEIKQVDDAMNDVEKAFEADAFCKENKAYLDAVDVLEEAKVKFEGLGDFRGDDSLRLAALAYVNFCSDYLENSADAIEELSESTNLTKEETLELETLTKAFFYEAILPYRNKVSEEYVKFMRKYGLIGFDK